MDNNTFPEINGNTVEGALLIKAMALISNMPEYRNNDLLDILKKIRRFDDTKFRETWIL